VLNPFSRLREKVPQAEEGAFDLAGDAAEASRLWRFEKTATGKA